MALREHKTAVSLIGLLISLLALAGAGVAAWTDLRSDVRANNVRLDEQSARMSRYEQQIQATLMAMQSDVNSIKQYLLERGQ